jgi:uncharacterized membrane protein HdeD (DUF308 family)
MATDVTTTTDQPVRETDVPVISWGWITFRGLLALLLGAGAFLYPLGTLLAFTLLFAAYALADGVASVIAAIAGVRRGERWWPLILRGMVGIAVGGLFLAYPLLTTVTYAMAALAILAAWSLLTGILEVAAAIRLRKHIEGEWLLLLSGLLSVLLGIAIPVVMFRNPLVTILSVSWIIGAYALAAAVVLVAQGLRLRRAGRRPGG